MHCCFLLFVLQSSNAKVLVLPENASWPFFPMHNGGKAGNNPYSISYILLEHFHTNFLEQFLYETIPLLSSSFSSTRSYHNAPPTVGWQADIAKMPFLKTNLSIWNFDV